MKQITQDTFHALVEQSKTLCVLDFYADWCGPCRMMAPVMEELEREYPDVAFYKINVDDERSLASMFHVESIPMIAFVKNNTFLDMSLGYVPKDKIKGLIEAKCKYLSAKRVYFCSFAQHLQMKYNKHDSSHLLSDAEGSCFFF